MWQDAAAGLIALAALMYLARALFRGDLAGGCGSCKKNDAPLISLDAVAPPPPVNPEAPELSDDSA